MTTSKKAVTLSDIQAQATKKALKEIIPGLVTKYGNAPDPHVGGPRVIRNEQAWNEFLAWKTEFIKVTATEAGIQVPGMLLVDVTKEEEVAMPKSEVAETPVVEQTAASNKRKTETVMTPHGEFRKDSVLYAIYRQFDLKHGATKQEILEALTKEFPERPAEHMATTIGVQINRMPKERGFELGRDDKGRYSIHISGRSAARVLSPEAEAKKAEKEAKAAAAKVAKEEAAAKAKADKEAAKVKAKAEADAKKAEAAAKQAAEMAAAQAKAAADKAKADEVKALNAARASKKGDKQGAAHAKS